MKLLFVISEDWYFCSHRKPIALAALQAGWDVHLGCQVDKCRAELEAAGIVLHHLPLRRGSINPLYDLGYLLNLVRLYRREKPDVVHHVAMKPCLYGSLAAWICRVPCVVNALAGMGFLFSSSKLAVRLVKWPVLLVFRLLFNRKNSVLILQNPDDISMFQDRIGVLPERMRMIRGSGVDLNVFKPAIPQSRNLATPQSPPPTFVMVSRLLRDKGVMELINAAGLLKERGASCRILLVGDADRMNPNAVDEAAVMAAQERGRIEWLGRRQDIADIYRSADVAVLPSYYGEGIPKSLIEAAACGLAIVTTDMPGCRETVRFQTEDGRLKTEDRRLKTEDFEKQTEDGFCSGGRTQRRRDAKAYNEAGSPAIPQSHNHAISQFPIGTNGILVPARDAVALADAMEWMVQHPDERQRMGRASRELAAREFGIEKVVEQTMAIYGGRKADTGYR